MHRRAGVRTGAPPQRVTSIARPAKSQKLPSKTKYALFAFGTVAAVVFAMAWNPPTADVHSFTSASDYKAERDSGCTNSGEGCHGSESAYKDFNDYHPNADCTTCHEYEGVGCIPCHSPREHECALCHDGSFKPAPDRVRISDPFPNGHYRETTHTAMATDMDKPVRIAENGEAKATCKDCHSRDLKKAHEGVPVVDGSTYGSDIGCGECHNDTRSFGQAEVLADWPKRSCEACHRVGSSSPMHGTTDLEPVEAESEFGCQGSGDGCHPETDLHLLHADEPKSCSGSAKKGEPGCHDLGVEAHLPTARTCGGTDADSCHRSVSDSGYEHKDAEHSPSTSQAARDRSYKGVACGDCHAMAPDGRSLITEHAGPHAAMSGNAGDACIDCHNNPGSTETVLTGWPEKDSSAACSACHGRGGIDAAHAGDFSALHRASNSDGCASTGAGCHPSDDLAAVGDPAQGGLHRDCLRCHDREQRDGNLAYDPTKRSCGEGRDCHATPGGFDPDTSSHRIAGQLIDGTDAAHDAGIKQAGATLYDPATGAKAACSSCHRRMLGDEHGRTNSAIAGDGCAGCHNANDATASVIKGDWPSSDSAQACAGCHDGEGAPQPHRELATAHVAKEFRPDGTAESGYCSEAGCHKTADVRVLHAGSGCTMAECHSATGSITGMGVMSCGGGEGQRACHAGDDYHTTAPTSHNATEIDAYGDAVAGSCEKAGCHATTDVRDLHPADGCQTAGCHDGDGPTLLSCGGGEGDEACHAGASRHRNATASHTATEIDAYGDIAPGTCGKAGCHGSADVRRIHTTKGCETPGCHVQGGPTLMTCGGGAGQEGSCHAGADRHSDATAKHQGTELAADGTPTEGACATAGCHKSTDVRTLHKTAHCETAGCHVSGGPTTTTCGGTDAQTSCHVQYEAGNHKQSHASDLAGTVGTVTYGAGENVGCLGSCHTSDLVTEHRTRLLGGALEGGGESVCAVCHEQAEGAGAYTTLSAVRSAITAGDRRCVACHASGSASDGPTAVGSPRVTCVPSASSIASVESVATPSAAPHRAGGGSSPDAEKRASTARRATTERRASEPTPSAPSIDEPREPEAPADPAPAPDERDEEGCTRGSDDTTAAIESATRDQGSPDCLDCHTVSASSADRL